jgi:1-deoxy-D-xylulose-5-phosphate reductoisomerase
MQKIAILGSTGSIGTQALEVVRTHSDRFKVTSMTAGLNIPLLREQLMEFKPDFAGTALQEDAQALSREFPDIDFFYGMEGLCAAATDSQADIVLNGLMGMLGLLPTSEAIKAGKNIAFANKETLVTGGELIMSAVKKKGIRFLPVDSEHSAIFQCMQGHSVKKIILTASGGPFRGYTREMLKRVTLEQALIHPKWSMGAKITIDSATMMNKGLEVIEAKWLFDIDASDIEVVVHPESILHSAVELKDGSVIGQMGLPDMKIPIAYALSYPEHMENIGKSMDFFSLGAMHFERPDLENFKCLSLAYRALEAGGSYPAVLNAANEEAVAAFLQNRINFLQIPDMIQRAMETHKGSKPSSIEEILAVEAQTRASVQRMIQGI